MCVAKMESQDLSGVLEDKNQHHSVIVALSPFSVYRGRTLLCPFQTGVSLIGLL